MIDDLESTLTQQGYYLAKGVLSQALCQSIRDQLGCKPHQAPIRDPLNKFFKLWDLIKNTQLNELFDFGPIIRSTFFTKPAQQNWQVPWHQDLVIQVKANYENQNYTAWSEKEGIQHRQPTIPILTMRRAFRIHLTQCHIEDAPLRVLPGTHQHLMNDQEIAATSKTQQQYICCEAGDVLIFNPLLLHASSKLQSQELRAVLHLEAIHEAYKNQVPWNNLYSI